MPDETTTADTGVDRNETDPQQVSTPPAPASGRAPEKRTSRRTFLKGAAVGAAGAWALTVLPRRAFMSDPDRPPSLYEFYLDNYWFDTVDLYRQEPAPVLRGTRRADVVILGGGFTGLSSAYNLARRFPDKAIALVEGALCGYGASGRNGGFADTGFWGLRAVADAQGPEVARAYFDATVRGQDQIRTVADEYGFDCDFEPNGSLTLAQDASQLAKFEAEHKFYESLGLESRVLDRADVQRTLHTDRFFGGFYDGTRAILNPAKLARGMKRAIERLGVQVFERSKIVRTELGREVRVVAELGELRAPQAVIALNGYAPQLGFFATRLLPLCNYIAATEPLSAAQQEAIGWAGREGLSDTRTQFMYLRPTADGRIVFGGEMSPYFYDSAPSSGNYAPAHAKLEASLLETFPQLRGVRFTHHWGGTMGFTADFSPAVGAMGDHKNVYYAVGFCGEGVVMTQLAGQIVADLAAGEETPITRLPFVHHRPPYVGAEPFRYPTVKLFEQWVTLTEGLH